LIAAFLALGGWPARARADAPSVFATVGSVPVGPSMPAGFVGVSLEYQAVASYAGSDPARVNPVLVALLGALAPGQGPIVRIGGDSTDATWWPVAHARPPAGASYALTRGWLRTTGALARDLHARLIMGINLAGNRPALAAVEARALLTGVGRASVKAFELGNEPDLYGFVPFFHLPDGRAVPARGRGYNLAAYTREFSRWRAALPRFPLAGPALSGPGWMSGLSAFLAAEPRVWVVTYHRYPLLACSSDPSSPLYPTIANLLADSSSAGLAQGVAPFAAIAHARGLQFRVGEMNSVACDGRQGVSNTFASALWMLDMLFNFAQVGVDGVNVHTLPGAAYQLFSFARQGARWEASVAPEYYAMLMFAHAFPPGARRLPVTGGDGPVKVWATRAADGTVRVVLINKDTTAPHTVQLQTPGLGGANLEWLRAPSADATTGVTLGGQSFGAQTSTGILPAPTQPAPLFPFLGSYSIDLPPASAVMLTQ
jgi:hypothetical protein